jgi:FKBP-type peptidyl-prolyl cis-trans isomerase
LEPVLIERKLVMNKHWIFLSTLLLLGYQANAQQSASGPQADVNSVNKERALSGGGKLSPRQSAELAKATRADTNQQAGTDFLASNKTKPGVVTLPSGVQYKVIKAGAGKQPSDTSSVTVRYQGTLLDGSGFDKVDDKAPTPMHVAGFVPGLKEAIKLMPVGSKWQVVIPPQLGYGAKGSRVVGANAVLIYDIEILGIN